MTQDYIGQIPEDFNPLESYGCNDYKLKDFEWDFEAREKIDARDTPSITNRLFIKLIKEHIK